jgi:tetratricopeptide (TPR) repeat protein
MGCPTLGCVRSRVRPARLEGKHPPSRALLYVVVSWVAVALALQAAVFVIGPEDRFPFLLLIVLGELGWSAAGLGVLVASCIAIARRPRRPLGWIGVAMAIAMPISFFATLSRARVNQAVPDPRPHAYELYNAGKYQEALDIYTADLGHGNDRDDWIEIAKCQDMLGHSGLAMAAFDRAEKYGPLTCWDCLARAHCLSQRDGPSVATAWLESRAALEKDPIFFQCILGLFHLNEKRYAEAVAEFSRHVEMATKKDGFVFGDDGTLVSFPLRSGKDWESGEIWWNAPANLARAQCGLGKLDEAFRSATMGLSLCQYRLKNQGYYDAAEIEAGDTECRVLRGWIYIQKQEYAAAQKELDYALKSKDGRPGYYYHDLVVKTQAELDSRRGSGPKDGAHSAH